MAVAAVTLLGLSVAPSVKAQTVVFNDTFAAGSTINSSPTSPAASLISKAAYQQLSAKTFSPNPPTIVAGHLRYGIVSTSSGFNSIEALFTQFPVTLANIGDYLEFTVSFTNQASLMNATNGSLFFGLHNSGQVQPIPGGMNATVGTATAGYAQSWQGYLSRIIYSGGTHSLAVRPAQTAAAANNQDVLYDFSGSTNVATATTPTVSALTTGQQYTEVFRMTKSGAAALTILSTLYQGADTTGTQLFTESATSSSILTATFDALAIGYRAVSGASVMDVNSIKVVTTGSATVVPVITQQPANKTVGVGDPVTFTVVASGGGAALSYQWQKDGANISGATSATCSITAAANSDAGSYASIVSDAAGSTTSNGAVLTVSTTNVPPSILQNPASATVVAGNANTFSATFTGSAPVNAKWQKSSDGGANYADIAGATTATSPASHTINNVQVADAGMYRLVATNAWGTATTSAATLTVNYAPVITTQPASASIYVGQSATFTVAANALPAPTFQWNKNGTAISGTTSASYTATSAGSYTVTVTNAVGSVTSNAAVLTVTDGTPPTISAPSGGFFPLTLIAGVGGTAMLPDYSNQAVTSDNVGVTSVTQSPAPGSARGLGATTVTLTAHDAAGHVASISFDVTIVPAGSPWPTLKVDLSRYTFRSDTAAPHFIEWQFDPASPARTFGPTTVLLRRVGTVGTQLDTNWYKFAIDAGALLALDGVFVKDVTTGNGQIEVVLSGLAAGHHTFAAYHNSVSSPATTTMSAISVAVNGVVQVMSLTPSAQVTNDYDIPTSYVEFDTIAGQDVVIAYTALGTGTPASANTPILNGFELDTLNPAKRATKPVPANDDEHVNGASGSVSLSWTAAPSAATHDFYLGTDAAAVTAANHASPLFFGNQSGPGATATGLDSFGTYWWRVDEVDAGGSVTRGEVWRFRIRHIAFPGAEGYGRFARGGRGGSVIEVTNLLDYNTDFGETVIPGSYRAAIEATGPRTVVFRVSGVIRLKKPCTINATNSYLTVAGQTAPGEGICLSQYSSGMLSANDVIIRHLRMRLGDVSQQAMDGMGLGGANHSIIDHSTISWTIDESTSSRSAKNITFQRNIISEALQHSYHYASQDRTKYETHAFAASISGAVGSFHHNLIAHCTGRNWSLAGGLNQGGQYAGQLDLRNNVVYNWQARTTDGGVKQCNFVNNYYKRGPAANSVTYLIKPDAGSASDRQQYYVTGNLMEDTNGTILYEGDNWNAAGVIIPSGATQTDIRVDTPFFPDYVTTHTPRDAFRIVLSDVGANARRDVIDQRIVREVRDGTWTYKGTIGTSTSDPR